MLKISLKKLAFGSVGIILFTAPLIVMAQSATLSDTCSASPTLECLQSEVQQLMQILNQLIAARQPQISCPNYQLPVCNGTFVSQGTDSNGCQLAPKCVPNTTVALSATPTSGTAPLAVTFSSNVNCVLYLSPVSVDFGDGSASVTACNNLGSGSSNFPVSHTYASSGTYTAKLTGQGDVQGGQVSTLGTVTITVSRDRISDSFFNATPSAGTSPLTVTFTGSVHGNSYTLDFGDGTPPAISAQASQCPATNQNCNPNPTISVNQSHTYTAAGTYTATLEVSGSACTGSCTLPPVQVLGAATIAVASTSGYIANPTVSLNANGQSNLTVNSGQTYTLNYGSTGASSCSLTYARTDGVSPLYGSNPVPANKSSSGQTGLIGSYTLQCIGKNGQLVKTSVTITLASQNTAPVITGGTTNNAVPGETIALTGSGFTASNAINIGATTIGSVAGNSAGTGLSFLIPSTFSPGVYQMTVSNGNGTSNKYDLVIAAATKSPRLSATNTGDANPGQTVHLSGTNFTDSNTIYLNGSSIGAFASDSPTALPFIIPQGQAAGAYQITVSNTNGISNPLDLRVHAPTPSASTGSTANLASALTALESALKALLVQLGHQ